MYVYIYIFICEGTHCRRLENEHIRDSYGRTGSDVKTHSASQTQNRDRQHELRISPILGVEV